MVPLSGNFNMALRKRVGGETAAFALRTYSVTYPAFIRLQRWLRCLQQEGEKYPRRREETSTAKDVEDWFSFQRDLPGQMGKKTKEE